MSVYFPFNLSKDNSLFKKLRIISYSLTLFITYIFIPLYHNSLLKPFLH